VIGCNNLASQIFSNTFDLAKRSFARVEKLLAAKTFLFPLQMWVTYKIALHCRRRAMVTRCKSFFLRRAFDED